MLPPLQWNFSYEAGMRRVRTLAVLVPLLGAALVLFAAVNSNDADGVHQGHRRLHHPHGDLQEYFKCMHFIDDADKNWDNALDQEEFKQYADSMARHLYKHGVGKARSGSMPKELKQIFTDYSQKTEGSSNLVIDVYGSGQGEASGINKHQGDLLEQLCNETHMLIVEMFKDEEGKDEEGEDVECTEEEEDEGEEGEERKLTSARCKKMTVKSLIPDEEEDVEEDEEEEDKPHHGPQSVAVNASFTLSLPEGITADDLQKAHEALEDLAESGEDGAERVHKVAAILAAIQDAFRHFTERVVGEKINGQAPAVVEEGASVNTTDGDGGNSTNATRYLRSSDEELVRGEEFGLLPGTIISFDGGVYDQDSGRRRLNVGLANNSAEVYKYVESPCPGATANVTNHTMFSDAIDAVESLIPAEGEEEEMQCVTAMGKFKIVVSEEEEEAEGGLASVYEKAAEAAKTGIEDGTLAEEMDRQPNHSNMFHLEGAGMVEDDSFDPYEDIETGEEEDKGLRTVDIILISVGSILIFCLCCVLCFVELERKTRPRPGVHH